MKARLPKFLSSEFHVYHCWCHHPQPQEFLQSQWQQKTRSIWFLIYRWVLAIFFSAALMYALISHTMKFTTDKFWYFFIYLTNWGLILCTICTVYGALLTTTWHYNKKYRTQLESTTESFEVMPRSFRIYWGLHNISLILSILITVMYWLVIYDSEKHAIDAKNILSHVLNAVMMFLDLIIVGHPVRLIHFIQPLTLGVIYCLFNYIYFLAGGTNLDGEPYVYRVLDWRNTTKSLIVFISVVIFGIMLHNLMFVIYKLRVLFYNLTMAKPVKPKVEEGNDGCGGHV